MSSELDKSINYKLLKNLSKRAKERYTLKSQKHMLEMIDFTKKLFKKSDPAKRETVECQQLINRCQTSVNDVSIPPYDTYTKFSNLMRFLKTNQLAHSSNVADAAAVSDSNGSSYASSNHSATFSIAPDIVSQAVNTNAEEQTTTANSNNVSEVQSMDVSMTDKSADQPPDQPAENGDKQSATATEEPSTSSSANEQVAADGDSTTDEKLTEKDKKVLATMEKLDRTLQKCSEAIRELESKEIDMDDMESKYSFYIEESRFKKRFDEIYCKLVDLCKKHPHLVDDSEIKLSKRVGGQFKKRVKFRGSTHAAINSEIEERLNKVKRFPDYEDVLSWLKEANQKASLGLDLEAIRKESVDAFKEIGRILKRRRAQDDLLVNSSRIESLSGAGAGAGVNTLATDATSTAVPTTTSDTDVVLSIEELARDDPADRDEEIQRKLEENKRAALEKAGTIFDEFIKKQQSGGDSSKDTDPLNGDNKETEATTTLAVLPKKASTKTTKTKSTKAAPRTTTEQQSNTSEDEDSDTLDIRLREKNEDDTDDDEDDDDDDDDDSSHVTSDDAEGDDDESQDDASDESDAEDEDEDDDAASVSDKQETTLTVTASSSSVVEHNEVATAAAESTTTHDALTADVVGQVVQECFTDQAPPQAQEAQASLKRCLSVTSTTSTVSQTNHSEVASVVIKKLRLVADIKQQTSSSENESSNRVARSSPRKAKLIPVTAKTITTKTATSKTSVVVDRNKRNESLSDDDDCIIID